MNETAMNERSTNEGSTNERSMSETAQEDAAIETIVGRGPAGAFAVAGIATALVVVLYLAFYFFAYLPRGIVQ